MSLHLKQLRTRNLRPSLSLSLILTRTPSPSLILTRMPSRSH
jgi:hypothetical protein